MQELGSFFSADWYSASTHNFVVFVHFSKLTHKCALFVKEWNSGDKGKCLEQRECMTTSSRYSQTLILNKSYDICHNFFEPPPPLRIGIIIEVNDNYGRPLSFLFLCFIQSISSNFYEPGL